VPFHPVGTKKAFGKALSSEFEFAFSPVATYTSLNSDLFSKRNILDEDVSTIAKKL